MDRRNHSLDWPTALAAALVIFVPTLRFLFGVAREHPMGNQTTIAMLIALVAWWAAGQAAYHAVKRRLQE
jgi:hypothetical protein